MAKQPSHEPIEWLAKKLLRNKEVMSIEVFSTFLHIPEEYLSNDEKAICYAYRILATAKKILKQYHFKISHTLIGKLCGISRHKATRLIPQLPGRLRDVVDKKLLGPGELVRFRIFDGHGNELKYKKGAMQNKDGEQRYYSFTYISPRDEETIISEMVSDEELRTEIQKPPAKPVDKPQDIRKKTIFEINKEAVAKYDPDKDPDYNNKKEILEPLSIFFEWEYLDQIMHFTATVIGKTVDYYFQSKKVKVKSGDSEPVFSFAWLLKAFYEYDIPESVVLKNSQKKFEWMLEWLTGIEGDINKLGIKHNFKFTHKATPKYKLASISNIPDRYLGLFDQLSPPEKDELELLAEKLYSHKKKYFESRKVDKDLAITYIKQVIVFKHNNII